MATGARFFRCDLQMQTPADRNRWQGPRMGDTEQDKLAAAQQFLRRCYEEKLEVIAVTDHNFASKEFIPTLQRMALRLRDEYGYDITILPGFEIQADVGRGMHVLAIFDPDKQLEVIDHTMTECGIPVQRFENGNPLQSNKRLKEIIDIVQRRIGDANLGIIICPHSQAEAGIFDDDKIAEFLQVEEFKNSDLLCIEVPKPVCDMSQNWQNLLYANEKCMATWKRDRPIACIMSSDCKALTAEEAANFIGFRSTWVKMEKPCVEGLRHAFLAHQSRIRLNEPILPQRYISSIVVGGCEFFEQRPFIVELNQQYNALIGGRGTGKSTILEYLRWALCDDPENQHEDEYLAAELPYEMQNRLALIDATLKTQNKEDAYVRVSFVINETVHTVTRYCNPVRIFLRVAEGNEREVSASDVRKLFPVQSYSQKQLSTVAVRIDEMRRILEAPIKSELTHINEQILLQKDLIRKFYEKLWRMKTIDEQIRSKSEHLSSLNAQIKNLKSQIKELTKEDRDIIDNHQKYLTEWQLILRIEKDVQEMSGIIKQMNDQIERMPFDYSIPVDAIEKDLLDRLMLVGSNAKKIAIDGAAKIQSELEEKVGELNRLKERWTSSYSEHKSKYDAAETRAKQYKVQLTQIKLLNEEIAGIQQNLDLLQSERNQLEIVPEEETEQRTVWFKLHKERGDMMEAACSSLSRLSQGAIRASIVRGGDSLESLAMLKERTQGARVRIEKLEAIKEHIVKNGNPAEEWSKILEEFKKLAELENSHTDSIDITLYPKLRGLGFTAQGLLAITRKITPKDWLDILLISLKDLPKFQYHINDNKYIPFETASPGQQATALLTILLNQQNVGPLIIDQPEDDLDNAIISEVVKTIWSAKEHRQMIFASHNANLVVNGDAELVLCCNYISSDNRSSGHIECSGSIDNTIVCNSVKAVMEGGKQAFELRKAKYGF